MRSSFSDAAASALFFFPSLLLFVVAAAVLPGAVTAAHAQADEDDDDLAEIVAVAGEQYVRGYATGLVEASSTALGSSLFFESGQANDLLGPVNLYVGVRVAAVPFSDDERSFSMDEQSTGQIRLQDGTLRDVQYSYHMDSAPTALGEHAPGPEVALTAHYRDADGEMKTEKFTFEAPQGLLGYLSLVPSAVPQAGLGIPALGLRVSVRYTPTIAFEDVGRRLNNLGVQTAEGALYGVGVRQALGAWADWLPFELSVYGYYQHIGVAIEEQNRNQDVLDFSLFSGGLNLSKPVLEEPSYSLSLFAGAGGQTSTTHFTYETPEEGESFSSEVDFDIEDPLRLRTQAGFSTRFGPLMINLGYAPLPRSTILGGIGLSL